MYINLVLLAPAIWACRPGRVRRCGVVGADAGIVHTAWHADLVVAHRSVFGRMTLVTGPEALLADRAVDQVVARARAEDPQVEISEIEAV